MCGMMAKEVKREEKSEQADEDKEDTAGWFFVLSQVCSEICRSYIPYSCGILCHVFCM